MDDEQSKRAQPGAPAWLATFADLMSLLMSFFVLLLAFSEMDILRFKQLAGSMSEAFGVQREVKTKVIPRDTSIIARKFSPGRPTPTALKATHRHTTKEHTAKRLEMLRQALKVQIANGQIEVTGDDEHTIIRIREKGTFPSGSADLSKKFSPVMKKIAAAIMRTPGQIQISGHTDNIPISTYRFRSNWELSSARAVSILQELLRHQQIPNDRIVIQGYADTRPLVPNTTAKNRAINRRVEIEVIRHHDSVREMPSLIKFSR